MLLDNEWIWLYIAFAVLGLATMRAKPNYMAVIIAGGFFAYAAWACPFPSLAEELMVALFGLYCAFVGALEMREPESDQAMEG